MNLISLLSVFSTQKNRLTQSPITLENFVTNDACSKRADIFSKFAYQMSNIVAILLALVCVFDMQVVPWASSVQYDILVTIQILFLNQNY